MASFEPTPSRPDRSRPSLPPAQVDCKWWKQGDCFRGSTCYFRHDPAVKGLAGANAARDNVEPANTSGTQEKCGICLEAPRTFGLLVKCDHVFCFGACTDVFLILTTCYQWHASYLFISYTVEATTRLLTLSECVKNWRGSANQRAPSATTTFPFTDDTRGLKKTSKTCPICRTHSDFIVPSAVFPSPATAAPDKEDRYVQADHSLLMLRVSNMNWLIILICLIYLDIEAKPRAKSSPTTSRASSWYRVGISRKALRAKIKTLALPPP